MYFLCLVRPSIIDDLENIQDSARNGCQFKIDPLKTHFYTVKLGFTGLYNILC